MVDNARKAGSGGASEPAREQVVIKDNRKIDAEGRPKNAAAENATGAEAKVGDKVESTMPDTTASGHKASPAQPSGMGQGMGQPSASPTQKTETTQKPATGEAKSAPRAEAEGKPQGGPEAKPGAQSAGEAGKPEGKATGEATVADKPAEEKPAEEKPAEQESAEEKPAAAAEPKEPLGAELEALRAELDERVKDLQRVAAEYANYRKRVERDRNTIADQAIGTVIGALLPILDDIERAREHGDLVGPFAVVAEQLNATLAKFGLTSFGEPGDKFDPTRHEAVAHQTSPDVKEPTCVTIMRRGYLLGERLLRPAMVAVADPE